MASGERLGGGNTGEIEQNHETSRQTYEQRGEKAIDAERLEHERRLLEERARLVAEMEAFQAELDAMGAETPAAAQSEAPVAEVASTEPEAAAVSAGEGKENNGETLAGAAVEEAVANTENNPVGGVTGGEIIAVIPHSDGTEEEIVLHPNSETVTSNAAGGEPEAVAVSETQPNPEEVRRTVEKARRHGGLKKFLTGVGVTALAALMLAGSFMLGSHFNKQEVPVETPAAAYVEVVDDEQEKIGIQDGYGEKGMWLSSEKSGLYNFACADEVMDAVDGDYREAIKYTAFNQSESFADYLAALPKEMQPEGMRGLSILEMEDALEAMSDEEYENLKDNFSMIMNYAGVRTVTLNGAYDNAYMRLDDTAGEVDHDNMQLVQCVTNEQDTQATEYFWVDKDGNEIGSMIVKTGTCMQVVTPRGSSDIYKGMPEIEENPEVTPEETPEEKEEEIVTPTPEPDPTPTPEPDPTPDPEPNPTPTPEPEKEWGKEGDPHAGDDVTPSDLVDPAAEVTEKENEETNKGNQGYVDDHQATPGSGSENNGIDEETGFADSGIVAPGATVDEERLPGGEDQSNGEMAGENAYFSEEEIEQGQAIDETGNQAQEQAQAPVEQGGGGLEVGGDNLTDAEEEAAVLNGDF